MGDLAGLPPFASGVTIHHNSHGAAAPAVPAVEASLPGQATGGQAHGHGSGGQPGHQPMPQQTHRPDPHALTGPPPAFHASLLDLEQDLAQLIARLEAARSLREGERVMAGNAAEGTGPVPESQDPPHETELPSPDSGLSPDAPDATAPQDDDARS